MRETDRSERQTDEMTDRSGRQTDEMTDSSERQTGQRERDRPVRETDR